MPKLWLVWQVYEISGFNEAYEKDEYFYVPSGKCLHNYRTSPFLVGKLTIFMAIFNSYVEVPEVRSTGSSTFRGLQLNLRGIQPPPTKVHDPPFIHDMSTGPG